MTAAAKLKSLVVGNRWTKNGQTFSYEITSDAITNETGDIAGEVWREEGALAFFHGYFKISADGEVVQFPGLV